MSHPIEESREAWLDERLTSLGDYVRQLNKQNKFLYHFASRHILMTQAARENPGVLEAIENLELALKLGIPQYQEAIDVLDNHYMIEKLQKMVADWELNEKDNEDDN